MDSTEAAAPAVPPVGVIQCIVVGQTVGYRPVRVLRCVDPRGHVFEIIRTRGDNA